MKRLLVSTTALSLCATVALLLIGLFTAFSTASLGI